MTKSVRHLKGQNPWGVFFPLGLVPLSIYLVSIALGGRQNEEVIEVNNRKQLFIDYRFSAEAEGIRLSVNPPQKRGLVIKGEYPWEEGWMGAYATVIDDEGVYKMWYRAHSLGKDGKRGRTSFCYATSQDGIHWEKPRLGLVDFNGHLDNNIVLVEGELNSVFLDPQASPEQRYKALLTIGWPDPEKGGVYIAYSADGLRWQTHPQRLLPLVPDTQNQVFYDTRLGKYVAYVRCWAPWRKMGRIEIENLLEPWPYDQSVKPYHIWGEDKVPVPSYEFHHAISYDEHDPPITDIYTPCVVQYPWAEEVYLAFPSIYYHFPEPPEGKYPNDGLLEVQLAVSREGMTFHRPERRPYIPLGLRGGPEGGSIYMLLGMIRRGDEIYQYYTAFAHSHGEYVGLKELRGIGGIYLAVQRLDGFMSVDADFPRLAIYLGV